MDSLKEMISTGNSIPYSYSLLQLYLYFFMVLTVQ